MSTANELRELGLMLTATAADDRARIAAIAGRLNELLAADLHRDETGRLSLDAGASYISRDWTPSPVIAVDAVTIHTPVTSDFPYRPFLAGAVLVEGDRLRLAAWELRREPGISGRFAQQVAALCMPVVCDFGPWVNTIRMHGATTVSCCGPYSAGTKRVERMVRAIADDLARAAEGCPSLTWRRLRRLVSRYMSMRSAVKTIAAEAWLRRNRGKCAVAHSSMTEV